jgi:hypothetical protein
MGLFQALKRRWLMALSLATVGAAVVMAIVWFTQPVTYTAHTLLEIKPTPPFLLQPIGGGDYANYKQTQIMRVRSLTVLNKALSTATKASTKPAGAKELFAEQKHKGLTKYADLVGEEALLAFQRDVVVDLSMGPEVMSIRMTGPEPEELVVLVAAVKDAYVEDILIAELTELHKRKQKLEDVKKKYDAKRKDAWQIYEALSGGSKDSKIHEMWTEMKLKQLAAAQGELLKIQADRLKEQTLIAVLEAQGENHKNLLVPPELVDENLKKEPEYARLLKHVSELQDDIEKMEAKTRTRPMKRKSGSWKT